MNIKNALFFVGGLVIGGFAAYKYTKTKYERIADEEIADVKAAFRELNRQRDEAVKDVLAKKETKEADNSTEEKEVIDESEEETDDDDDEEDGELLDDDEINSYEKTVEYFKKYYGKKADSTEKKVTQPYVIDYDDFDSIDDYTSETVIYYADGFICSEDDIPMQDIDGHIGYSNLAYFDSDIDSLYVRNEKLKVDYEILRSNNNFEVY